MPDARIRYLSSGIPFETCSLPVSSGPMTSGSWPKFQPGHGCGVQGIDRHRLIRESTQPADDAPARVGDLKSPVSIRELGEVGFRQPEQRGGGTGAGFLQVDKRSGELDEALVEIPRGLPPDGQPELFEDFVRLEVKLPVEAIEPRQVTRILALPSERGGERRNFLGLGIHAAERSRRVARNKAPGAAWCISWLSVAGRRTALEAAW